MTRHSGPHNPPAKDLQFREVLVDMPEPDLARLLRRAKALRQELRLIRVSNGEIVETVMATRKLLRTWIGELEGVLIAKRSTDTASWLRSWDNEGGATNPVPTQPLSSDADGETQSASAAVKRGQA